MTVYKLNRMEYKFAFSSRWQKLFFHDLKSGLKFNSDEEVLYSIDESRYSILSLLDDNAKCSEGKFEFLLEYPDRGSSFYFRWKQLNNPINEEETEGMTSAKGFESFYNGTNTKLFGGLVKTSGRTEEKTLSFLNGVPSRYGSSNFNFAVGIFAKTYYKNGDSEILYNYPVGDQIGAEQCALWVKLPIKMNCQNSFASIKLLVFLMIFVINK